MEAQNCRVDRRAMVKSSVFGLLAVSLPNVVYAGTGLNKKSRMPLRQAGPNSSFPNIDPEIVSSVVGASHFDLEKVKELVDKRPELARANWEWRFGDWESAIGAASHVGRRDIVFYLMDKGARPSIFTFAMLGAYDVVKSMIEFQPGIQKTMGPHGISLLQHAKTGSRMQDTMSSTAQDNLKRLVDYLEALGDADGETYLDVSPKEQEKYLGDYKYGDGPEDGFRIQLNMRKMLALGPIGGFGGALYKIGEHKFTYNGAPSVVIAFEVENGAVQSLTVHDPEITITAMKIK
ncbi:MAG: hypothetical protein KDD10_26985 [Phaeodactylibacter sp.]|nr:hypothetical protein [Phaeodactylibacter sp.]